MADSSSLDALVDRMPRCLRSVAAVSRAHADHWIAAVEHDDRRRSNVIDAKRRSVCFGPGSLGSTAKLSRRHRQHRTAASLAFVRRLDRCFRGRAHVGNGSCCQIANQLSAFLHRPSKSSRHVFMGFDIRTQFTLPSVLKDAWREVNVKKVSCSLRRLRNSFCGCCSLIRRRSACSGRTLGIQG